MLNTIVVPAVVMGSLYALIALGLNVLVHVTGVINFAFGDLLAWAPLAVMVGITILHLPLAVSLAGSAAFVIVIALLEERIAIRPFIGSAVAFPWILSTLAVSLILEQLASRPFEGNTLTFEYDLGERELSIGPVQTTPVAITIVCTAIFFYVALRILWRYTSLGRMLAAVSDDPTGAAAIGISARRASQLAALLAAIIAFGAGIVSAPELQVYPSLGLTLMFTGFIAVAMGGVGSIGGGLAGGVLVGLVTQIISVYLSPTWINMFLFLGLLSIYMVRSEGLFGRATVRLV